jgi:hypothetical protein
MEEMFWFGMKPIIGGPEIMRINKKQFIQEAIDWYGMNFIEAFYDIGDMYEAAHKCFCAYSEGHVLIGENELKERFENEEINADLIDYILRIQINDEKMESLEFDFV